jgi:hypothetical protein
LATSLNQINPESQNLGESFFDAICRLFLFATFEGVKVAFTDGREMTLSRIQGPEIAEGSGIPKRTIGEALLPFVRADLNYQHVSSRIYGIDGRIESGYGPFGIHFRDTHYVERDPKNSLDFRYIQGLYRISTDDSFDFSLGLGGLIMDGEKVHGGFSMTFPLEIYPYEHFGFRLSPTWSFNNGNAVSDYEAAIAYSRRFYSLRAGFRRTKVQDQILKGPFLGVSYHY